MPGDMGCAPRRRLEPAVWLRRLMQALLRDTVVVIATVVAINLLRMLSSIALTRLLVPEAFGIVGLIGSLSFVLSMISDLGFQAFVIRHAEGSKPAFLDAIWTIRLVRAAALTLVLALAAGPIAAALGKLELRWVIAFSSLQFVIEGASSLSLVTALRERQLVRLSALDIIGALVQLATSIALVLVWRSYWAIVVAMTATTLVRTALSYAMFPGSRRNVRWDRHYAAQLWAFARYVTGSSIISMMLMQSDKLVLARFLPLDQFGLYILAGNLALAPMSFTSAYASRVLYPLYARAWQQEPERFRQVCYAARWRISILYALGTGVLIGTAPLLVAILYDPRYAHAALYLRLLAITPVLALASMSANEALTASGRVHVTFTANLAKLGWLATVGPASFLLGGPVGLVACVGLLELPTLLYSWGQLHRHHLLDLPRELVFLGCSGAGIALGYGACAILLPLV